MVKLIFLSIFVAVVAICFGQAESYIVQDQPGPGGPIYAQANSNGNGYGNQQQPLKNPNGLNYGPQGPVDANALQNNQQGQPGQYNYNPNAQPNQQQLEQQRRLQEQQRHQQQQQQKEQAHNHESHKPHLFTVDDYEQYAIDYLPKARRDYMMTGSVRDETLHNMREGFSKVKVVPRYLRNVAHRCTNTTIFNGKTFRIPIGIDPSSFQQFWHPDGENATIRAASNAGTIMILSSLSSIRLEEVAQAAPQNTEKWFQTFFMRDTEVANDLVRRAERAGFNAIVLAIDHPVSPWRVKNAKNGFSLTEESRKGANFLQYSALTDEGRQTDAFSWADLEMLVKSTPLPVVVKGCLTPADAKLAYQAGAKGIIVSNHGGRQLDGAISSIEALADISREFPDASARGFDIYLDSGIRNGLDVFRALALGAKMVFVGRVPMWGLFHSGQQGIEDVLEIVRKELDVVMAQAGCPTVSSINRELVRTKF